MQYLAFAIFFLINVRNVISQGDPFPPLPEKIVPSKYDRKKIDLMIPVITNYNPPVLPSGALCTKGIQLALDAGQRNNLTLFQRYNIVVKPYDDMCQTFESVNIGMKIFRNADTNNQSMLPVVNGPLCSGNRYNGAYHHFYNFVGISDYANAQELFSKRSMFNSFFTIGPSLESYYVAIPHFLKSNGWNNVYLFSETKIYWKITEQVLFDTMTKLNISLGGMAKLAATQDDLDIPDEPAWHHALSELAAYRPRIIVVHSTYGAMMSCWLHRYKIYGPNVVIIWVAWANARPNDAFRPPWCTNEMLFEVIQSIIYYWASAPINMQKDAVDEFGITRKEFESFLEREIYKPDITMTLYFWARTVCYNQLMASLLVLDSVEKQLLKENDTMGNWVTNGQQFLQNGSYIHKKLKNGFENLRFKSFSKNDQEPVHSRKGVTGFFQMQVTPCQDKACEQNNDGNFLTSRLNYVPVASFDELSGKDVVATAQPYFWRTFDKLPPRDYLKVVPVQRPIINLQSEIGIRLVASSMGFINLLLLALNIVQEKRGREEVRNSLPMFNSMILVGNLLAVVGVLLLPIEVDSAIAAKCMAGSAALLIGFYLVIGPMLAKLHIAAGMLVHGPKIADSSQRVSTHRRSFFSTRSRGAAKRTSTAQIVVRTMKQRIRAPLQTLIVGLAFCCVLLAAWFAIEPFFADRYERGFLEDTKVDVEYNFFTYGCRMHMESNLTSSIIIIFVILFGCMLLRSFYLAIVLHKGNFPLIIDIQLVRATSYSVGLIALAGAAVIYLFFSSSDPGNLQIGISGLVLIMVFVSDAIIFAPKIKAGNFI